MVSQKTQNRRFFDQSDCRNAVKLTYHGPASISFTGPSRAPYHQPRQFRIFNFENPSEGLEIACKKPIITNLKQF